MKRLISAIILLIFVLSAYLTGYFYINTTCEKANKMLTNCEKAYNANENAEKYAKKLEKFWSDAEKPLSLFANHSEIDEIELAIHTLKIYSKTSEKEIFNEYSGTVKTLIHQLIEDTVPSVHSIF